MPTPFDALDAAISRAVNAAFGETTAATIQPRTRSEYAEGNDATRPARSIRGVFSEVTIETDPAGVRNGDGFDGVTKLSVVKAEFWMPAAEAAALPYAIKPGDRLTLNGRAGAPTYTVTEPRPTQAGDINLLLARESAT